MPGQSPQRVFTIDGRYEPHAVCGGRGYGTAVRTHACEVQQSVRGTMPKGKEGALYLVDTRMQADDDAQLPI